MSIKKLVLVSRKTRTVFTVISLKTLGIRKRSIEQGNLWSKIAQMHRLGLYLTNKVKWFSQNITRKLIITNFHEAHAEQERRIRRKELWRQQKDFREVPQQSLTEMEGNYENSKVLLSIRCRDESSSRTRTLFLKNQEEYKNYKMKKIAWTILRISRMLNQFAHRPAKKNRQAFGTHMIFRETFLQIQLHLHQLLNLMNWINGIRHPRSRFTVYSGEKRQTRTKSRFEMPLWTVSQRFSHLQWKRFFKQFWGRPQRLETSDFHFDKFLTPATFVCWKIRFKTEVCTCSQFPTEAMQWIKEVELVDSVDELRSSLSTRDISMSNFDVFDARIASALNKIIHNSHFKSRISL